MKTGEIKATPFRIEKSRYEHSLEIPVREEKNKVG